LEVLGNLAAAMNLPQVREMSLNFSVLETGHPVGCLTVMIFGFEINVNTFISKPKIIRIHCVVVAVSILVIRD